MLSNLFFNSVKYFNKPKPCGIFFRCLNCAPDPTSPSHYFGHHFFSFSSIWCQPVVSVRSPCACVCLPPNSFLVPSISVVDKSFCCGNLQKPFSVLKKSNHLNLFHRVTILFHKLCTWTISSSVWSSNCFDKGSNLLFSRICHSFVSVFTTGVMSLA